MGGQQERAGRRLAKDTTGLPETATATKGEGLSLVQAGALQGAELRGALAAAAAVLGLLHLHGSIEPVHCLIEGTWGRGRGGK